MHSLPSDLYEEVMSQSAREAEEKGRECIWLDPHGACSNYEHRPFVCREFQTGGELCLEHRKVYF